MAISLTSQLTTTWPITKYINELKLLHIDIKCERSK